MAVDSSAGGLTYDLAIDASGAGAPSRVAAGLDLPSLEHAGAVVDDGGTGIDVRRMGLAVAASLAGILAVVCIAAARPRNLTR